MKKKHGSIFCLCLGVLFVAGCVNQSEMQDGDEYPTKGIFNPRVSELYQKRGAEKITIEGKLSGDSIVYYLGAEGDRGKFNNPMTIRLDEYELALTARSENVARQLIRYSAKNVRLLGRMNRQHVWGDKGSTGQPGYSGPIPDHNIFFFYVDSVTLVDKGSK